jgi:hypothetical protein
VGALIFDFDGVIADSEAIANTVLAETVTGLGHSTTLDQALTRYMGRRWGEVVAEIEAAIGKPLPDNFSDQLKLATLARFRTDLKEVSGATDFIRRFAHIPRCIASSSSIACNCAYRCWPWKRSSALMFTAPTWWRAENRIRTFFCTLQASSGLSRVNAS